MPHTVFMHLMILKHDGLQGEARVRGRRMTAAIEDRCVAQMEVSETDHFLPIHLDIPEVLCLAVWFSFAQRLWSSWASA